MGTVPIGTGELRTIHSRVSWMLRPVERSMTVSAPQRIAHTILSTSDATSEATALLPILALILTRKLRPIAIGSDSGWLMLLGMIARPRATSSRTNSGVTKSGMAAPKDSPSRSEFGVTSRPRFSRMATYSISGVTTPRQSEEHTSELQSPCNLVCRLLLEKKKNDAAFRHD